MCRRGPFEFHLNTCVCMYVLIAETNKMRDCKPPPSTQAVHIIPMAFDVYGRWGEKVELELKQAARRRLENVMR